LTQVLIPEMPSLGNTATQDELPACANKKRIDIDTLPRDHHNIEVMSRYVLLILASVAVLVTAQRLLQQRTSLSRSFLGFRNTHS
jgi:hypothetical protein